MIIELPIPLNLATEKNLVKIVGQAKQHLKSMSFLDVNWESNQWHYVGNNKIYFSYFNGHKRDKRILLPPAIADAAKSAVVKKLHQKRLTKLPTVSYMTDCVRGFYWMAQVLHNQHPVELTQDGYSSLVAFIDGKYKEKASALTILNSAVKFLNKHDLVTTSIEIIKSTRYERKNEFGLKGVHDEKMPEKSLVKAVIDLKHVIDDCSNPDERYLIDKLCINTQAFQFGMGLRICEVLRLSVDCIKHIEGEPYLLVWTEKGQIPVVRYIPKIWRPVIFETIKEIKQLTKQSRKAARQLEKDKTLSIVEKRLSKRLYEYENKVTQFYRKVDSFLKKKKKEAQTIWVLQKVHQNKKELSISELASIDYLPVRFASEASSLVRDCRKRGITLTKRPLGKVKHCNSLSIKELNRWLDEKINERANHVTQEEFVYLLTGTDDTAWGLQKEILYCTIRKSAKVFYPKQAPFSYWLRVIPVADAKKLGRSFITGGYDIKEWLVYQDFLKIFPEFAESNAASNNTKRFVTGKVPVYRPAKNKSGSFYQRYLKSTIINIESIKNFLFTQFCQLKNYAEQEISLHDRKDNYSDITIESKSFSVKQKVSEYLFLHPNRVSCKRTDGLVPQILCYDTVKYFFKGTPGYNNAFDRYGIAAPKEITKRFQTHKGRHWQTTSLFRAGAPDYVVDLYMGRTPGQGRRYDHNTGIERAEQVKKLLLEDTANCVGHIADKVRTLQSNGKTEDEVSGYLNNAIVTAHWTPYGSCVRMLALNPCKFNVRCIRGDKGEGCNEFIVSKKDKEAINGIKKLVNQSEVILCRLLKLKDEGNIHAEKHMTHHMQIVKNGIVILNQLNNRDCSKEEFKPFPSGSSPDKCPFQSGDAEN